MKNKHLPIMLQKMVSFFGIIILIQVTAATDENLHAVQYTTQTFESEVAKQNHFIMFYTPWDENYQRLALMWEMLAKRMNKEAHSRVRIAKVDCTKDRNICSENDIMRYTTLKFFKTGKHDGIEFMGTQDLPSLNEFINEQLEDSLMESKIKISIKLTEETFNNHIVTGRHFVQFYAPRSGRCQKLASTWDELTKSFAHDTSVNISDVDCTQHRSVCEQFNIKSYPTLLWIENGKEVDEYLVNHAEEDLKGYVNKMLQNVEAKGGRNHSVLTANGELFQLENKKGITFIKFFAPWDGWSKHMAPAWEELENKFIDNKMVHIVKVDCTLTKKNIKFCDEQIIPGFPRFFLYKDGIFIADYDGSRTPDAFYEFVTNYLPSRDEL